MDIRIYTKAKFSQDCTYLVNISGDYYLINPEKAFRKGGVEELKYTIGIFLLRQYKEEIMQFKDLHTNIKIYIKKIVSKELDYLFEM